jgi:hypothetical protein
MRPVLCSANRRKHENKNDLTLALCFVGVAVVFAEDANIGTWKLNEAKSTFAAGATRNTTVVYEAAGENVKVTVDGTDKDGKPTHNEWTGKFDGRDYPVTGDPNTDARSLKRIDDHTLGLSGKKEGKIVTTGSNCRVGRWQDPHCRYQRS